MFQEVLCGGHEEFKLQTTQDYSLQLFHLFTTVSVSAQAQQLVDFWRENFLLEEIKLIPVLIITIYETFYILIMKWEIDVV